MSGSGSTCVAWLILILLPGGNTSRILFVIPMSLFRVPVLVVDVG